MSGNLIVGVAGEGAAEADGVLPSAVDVKVYLSDQSVITAMDGRVEAVATEIESTVFTVSRTVATRVLLEHGQDA